MSEMFDHLKKVIDRIPETGSPPIDFLPILIEAKVINGPMTLGEDSTPDQPIKSVFDKYIKEQEVSNQTKASCIKVILETLKVLDRSVATNRLKRLFDIQPPEFMSIANRILVKGEKRR
jgi:hypothetical protein